MTEINDLATKTNESTDDIRSALWHIAAALNGIKLKLDQLDATTDALIGIASSLEAFAGPYLTEDDPNGKYQRHLELLEKQVALMEEKKYMREYRK
jgi:hypothetical protein